MNIALRMLAVDQASSSPWRAGSTRNRGQLRFSKAVDLIRNIGTPFVSARTKVKALWWPSDSCCALHGRVCDRSKIQNQLWCKLLQIFNLKKAVGWTTPPYRLVSPVPRPCNRLPHKYAHVMFEQIHRSLLYLCLIILEMFMQQSCEKRRRYWGCERWEWRPSPSSVVF